MYRFSKQQILFVFLQQVLFSDFFLLVLQNRFKSRLLNLKLFLKNANLLRFFQTVFKKTKRFLIFETGFCFQIDMAVN